MIRDLAQWDELATICDTTIGTDALTLTGRIRHLDDALEPACAFDLDDLDTDLSDLAITSTVDAVLD